MEYRPKKGDRFNAIVRYLGKVAMGSPCRCTKNDVQFIYAIDTNGAMRQFNRSDFVFEKVKDGKKNLSP